MGEMTEGEYYQLCCNVGADKGLTFNLFCRTFDYSGKNDEIINEMYDEYRGYHQKQQHGFQEVPAAVHGGHQNAGAPPPYQPQALPKAPVRTPLAPKEPEPEPFVCETCTYRNPH